MYKLIICLMIWMLCPDFFADMPPLQMESGKEYTFRIFTLSSCRYTEPAKILDKSKYGLDISFKVIKKLKNGDMKIAATILQVYLQQMFSNDAIIYDSASKNNVPAFGVILDEMLNKSIEFILTPKRVVKDVQNSDQIIKLAKTKLEKYPAATDALQWRKVQAISNLPCFSSEGLRELYQNFFPAIGEEPGKTWVREYNFTHYQWNKLRITTTELENQKIPTYQSIMIMKSLPDNPGVKIEKYSGYNIQGILNCYFKAINFYTISPESGLIAESNIKAYGRSVFKAIFLGRNHETVYHSTGKSTSIIIGPESYEKIKNIPIADQPLSTLLSFTMTFQKKIIKLINQLANESFEKRKKAKNNLKAFGMKIWPILEKYSKNKDPEIRSAIKELMDPSKL